MVPLVALLVGLSGSRLELASGKMIEPLASHGQKASVLIFVLADCPIAREFSPEIRKVYSDFGGKGVSFVLVHVDRTIKSAEMKKHAREFGISFDVAVDRRHDFVRLAKVTKVPSAAILDAKGRLVYSGRIDDRYKAFGVQATPKRRDLRVALGEVLAGKSVSVARTETVGCFVPD